MARVIGAADFVDGSRLFLIYCDTSDSAYRQLFKTPEAASACLASGMNLKEPSIIGDEQAVTITTDMNNPSTSELTNFVSRASKDGMWITGPLSAYDALDERLRADEVSYL